MKRNHLLVNDVKKIAILRANALGDFIVTLPAIYALKAAYPDAELVLLGKPWHQDFLVKGRTPVDRVIVIPVTKGLREEQDKTEDPEEVNSFLSRLKKEQFDIAIHFHGKGLAANPFINRLGARVTAGTSSEDAEPVDRSLPYIYYQSEVIRFLEVVSLVGAYGSSFEPRIRVLPSDYNEASSFTRREIDSPLVVLHPCGTDTRRMWTIGSFAQVADQLAEHGCRVIFSGAENDRTYIENIRALMNRPSETTCGRLSLGGLAAFLSSADLFIGCDTGPLHLARAVQTKTIGLYWAPNLINWGPLTRMDHRPVVSWNTRCKKCGIIPNDPWPFEPVNDLCSHNYSFIEDITPEQVMNEARYLLSSIRSKSSPALL